METDQNKPTKEAEIVLESSYRERCQVICLSARNSEARQVSQWARNK